MTKKEKNRVIMKRDLEWIKVLLEMGMNNTVSAAYKQLLGKPFAGRKTDSDWQMDKGSRNSIDVWLNPSDYEDKVKEVWDERL